MEVIDNPIVRIDAPDRPEGYYEVLETQPVPGDFIRCMTPKYEGSDGVFTVGNDYEVINSQGYDSATILDDENTEQQVELNPTNPAIESGYTSLFSIVR